MTNLLVRILVSLASLGGSAGAQTALEQQLAAQRRLLNDWAGLIRYGSENTEIRPPGPGEQRVVFLGDEITELWGSGSTKFFPGGPYLNRGIGRQATPQMLVRFRQDVISLRPNPAEPEPNRFRLLPGSQKSKVKGQKSKVMVAASPRGIAGLLLPALAARGDFARVGASLRHRWEAAGFSGPATQGMIAENFMSMTELAKVNGIRVVLASLTPVCDCFTQQTQQRPPGKIMGMNTWLKDYAGESGSVYLDYYSALADGRTLKKEFTSDGFLLNDAAYLGRTMTPAASVIPRAARDLKELP